ncbi:hypothetical protein HMPREF3152_08690 [Actinomyces sp. HMSC06A08]|uniref:Uncharacterized protein n=1 Tax=Winkia neuii TaxID=33007 RepID=A0A2I1IQ48_9ACTO|nr:hypothetical protein HMPREF3198_00881 [Winkia neuii]OFJ72245.1 hypothetical protein HMPREF2851_04790 [Actinomyces sp. HMSC064C12]OFK01960.1 hypothetical protein HMPREF2835_08025 [Actinomyces sp. HMSC072A03]OFT54544.1 hypothetical protein HMPREF3152_08690 [Actinomyces sp. HMSC06A08]PKY73238.1 hypothetical protein CYJ19_01220 [Winkia neuii]
MAHDNAVEHIVACTFANASDCAGFIVAGSFMQVWWQLFEIGINQGLLPGAIIAMVCKDRYVIGR